MMEALVQTLVQTMKALVETMKALVQTMKALVQTMKALVQTMEALVQTMKALVQMMHTGGSMHPPAVRDEIHGRVTHHSWRAPHRSEDLREDALR
jgi:ABC-type transporter Mla subunit MlaD